jgi:hypothetical protein
MPRALGEQEHLLRPDPILQLQLHIASSGLATSASQVTPQQPVIDQQACTQGHTCIAFIHVCMYWVHHTRLVTRQ